MVVLDVDLLIELSYNLYSLIQPHCTAMEQQMGIILL